MKTGPFPGRPTPARGQAGAGNRTDLPMKSAHLEGVLQLGYFNFIGDLVDRLRNLGKDQCGRSLDHELLYPPRLRRQNLGHLD